MESGVGADRAAESLASDEGETRTSGPAEGSSLVEPALSEDRLPAPLQQRDRERYRIIGEHGRGGLGRVFRAHDREMGRDVAIKELLQRGNTAEIRFFREALITARLEHPGIVPVHEAGRWPDGTPFYAMKLVAGRPFKAVIDQAKTLEDRLALLPHVIAVADAIAYAHDHKIIHRDLKPANVMIGEFGETVVIDWGLAKDLQDAAADTLEEGPYRTAAVGGLTAAGAVLGTPAYMAPEQLKGVADERSDIYALGGILFHVLTGASPAPNVTSDAPRDVWAVAERAMASQPTDRYPNARAFSDDIRRFMQHRPIAARRYSLAARAALGFVRHRTVALALITALLVIVGILVVSLVNLEKQRSRELAARQDADKARATTETSKAELELKHAELLLTVDPTAAADLLSNYSGTDAITKDRLLAKARGLGVAVRVAFPHTDEMWFLASVPDGGLISIGGDGSITESFSEHDVTLATDAALIARFGYSAEAQRLAYPRSPRGISLLEIASHQSSVLDEQVVPREMAMSPDGTRLAVASTSDELVIWDLSEDSPRILTREAAAGVRGLAFVTNDVVAMRTVDALTRIALGKGRQSIALSDGLWVIATDTWIATDTMDGLLHVVSADGLVVVNTLAVCPSRVSRLFANQSSSKIGIACQAGTMAAWELDGGREIVRVDLHSPVEVVTLSPDNRYLAGGGASGVLFVHDTVTSVTRQYRGHPARILSVAAPSINQPFFGSADVNGTLRFWHLDTETDRVLLRAGATVFHAVFSPDSHVVVTDGYEGIVRAIKVSDQSTREIIAGDGALFGVRFGPDGKTFVTWGGPRTVRVWNAADLSLRREMRDHVGRVEDVVYVNDDTLVSVGIDGAVLSWSLDETITTTILRNAIPMFRVVPLGRTGDIVVSDVDGNLMLVSASGSLRRLADSDGSSITMLKATSDGNIVARGTSRGVVTLVDTKTGVTDILLRAKGPIRYIAFSGADFMVAASEDGSVHMRPMSGDGRGEWREFPAKARYIAVAKDGGRIAITCADGGVWIYEFALRAWTFLATHDASVESANFSNDGKFMATSDAAGVVAVHSF